MHSKVALHSPITAQIKEAKNAESVGGDQEDQPIGCIFLHNLSVVEHCGRIVGEAATVHVEQHGTGFAMLKCNDVDFEN